ncbi:MAG: sulfite exporter TauE/SafE family protein [Desulfobulbaceae bacterium]|nr:sulfite exporter TauE/SafE family protein [Desulfobulbaceae bacterium]
MKRLLFLILGIFLIMPVHSAMAGGGAGPSKDMMKGEFTMVDASAGTATFIKNGAQEPMILNLPEGMTADAINLDKKVMVTLDSHAGEGVIKDVSVMFLDMNVKRVAALLLIGLIGGLLSGFIGSGGAFVLTPAMMSLGVPGAIAVASNMCHKFPKAMVGAYKRYKYGQADIKLGLVMAVTAIIGVQIGIMIQKYILKHWGNAGSNLYVSTVFVFILVVVGGYVLYDAYKLAKGTGEAKTPKLAQALMKINLPPMMEFKVAKVRISAWVTIPVGLLTGMLAATIAVGGFIGVPGMIYVVGASAVVASATELIIAFIMGAWGSIQWGLAGLIDIRLTLLILAGSLIGVQLGALGTTYVKDHMIKIVMAAVMLIVAVSRGAKVPGYLADVGLRGQLEPQLASLLESVSYWSLIVALASAGLIITTAMVKGMMEARAEERVSRLQEEGVSHG